MYFRYGGWYSDMDTITVAKSDHLENVAASSGDFVANGNLIFSARNGFLRRLMIQAEKIYTSVGWNSLGFEVESMKIQVLYLKINRTSSSDQSPSCLMQWSSPYWSPPHLLEHNGAQLSLILPNKG